MVLKVLLPRTLLDILKELEALKPSTSPLKELLQQKRYGVKLKWINILEGQDIGLDDLPNMTEEGLTGMGISALGARNAILRAAKEQEKVKSGGKGPEPSAPQMERELPKKVAFNFHHHCLTKPKLVCFYVICFFFYHLVLLYFLVFQTHYFCLH